MHAASGPLDLSVVTICRDNATVIGRMLDAVAPIAAEIVAVDSGSTDGTVELLRGRGAIVVHQPWLGHVRQKQRAIALARRAWVLHLDSDESPRPDLVASIRRVLEADPAGVAGARVRRVVWYRDKPLRHAWQPEWRTRLTRTEHAVRGLARWTGRDPHDRLEIDPAAGRLIDLDGVLRHDSFETFEQHLHAQIAHARTNADGAAADAAPPSLIRLALSPAGAFLKQLVLKRAYADGHAGWLAAGTAAAGSLAKHMLHLERALLEADNTPRPDYDPFEESSTPPKSPPRDAPPHQAGAALHQQPQRAHDPALQHEANVTTEQPQPDNEAQIEASTDTATHAPTRTEDSQTEDSQTEDSDHRPAGHADPAGDDAAGQHAEGDQATSKKKRRRKRRRKKKTADGAPETAAGPAADDADDADDDRSGREKLKAVLPVSEEARKHVFNTETTFRDLGLNDELLSALDDHGWVHPTKIQAQLIPVALQGRDVLGQAKTGSGKTAAFGLPILQLARKGTPFQTLILAPTRELAIQIRDDLEELARHTGIRVVPVYGGQKIQTQARKLEKQPEIIVGTPGRIMDMNNRGLLPLNRIRFAVLDEVDRMFDIGFRDDIKRILGLCPDEKQTIFVSATISEEIERLVRKHMRDPERLEAAGGSLTVEMVRQHHISVQPWDKRRMLHHLLTHEEPDLTIVFCRMKRTVDMLAGYLERKGVRAIALHGDLTQGQRNSAMREFRHGELNVLIASDLAARGLDVEGISHVVNYDLPEDPDLYVHRIGRTARAGREGVAWSLVTPEQGPLLTQIENLINAEIPLKSYPEFDARTDPPENWKPEPKPGFQPYIVEGAGDQPKSRFEVPEPPPTEELTPEELERKFPGGAVPKKPPRKVLRGRVRTGRGK